MTELDLTIEDEYRSQLRVSARGTLNQMDTVPRYLEMKQ